MFNGDYEDNLWPEDAICLERNSRDFVLRNVRINQNAELLCTFLKDSIYGVLPATKDWKDQTANV